jgi:putative ABC transport system substrate-binding protein
MSSPLGREMNNRRRLVVALGAAVWPMAARAQQPKKVYRIGYLSGVPRLGEPEEAFRQRLGELGYADGKGAAIHWRFFHSNREQIPGAIADFLRLRVDCIVVIGVASVRAAKRATDTIPIVIGNIEADPVEQGFVASFARPGGNVTGFTGIAYELADKRTELLKELAPKATRAVALVDATGTGETQRAHLKEITAASTTLGLRLKVIAIRGPEELEGAATNAAREWGAELLHVVATGWLNSHRERIVRFANNLRVPAIYSNSNFVGLGGLMSYAADRVHQSREVAGYVARILSGTKPADLPVQQPTEFELVVNLKTAKALGIAIPPTIMVRATRVIQ